LQILFYYDIIVVAIYLLNFYSGLSMCPVTAWIIQGCGAVIKMTQLLRSCWLSWGSDSDFWSFLHINILL